MDFRLSSMQMSRKKDTSKFFHYAALFFDLLYKGVHYASLVFLLVVNIVIFWIMFYKIDLDFSLLSFGLWSFALSIFFSSVGFYIHHYIYSKDMNIDLDVIRGRLSVKKALNMLKKKENSPPAFNTAVMFYSDFGAFCLFKKSKNKLYKDINVEEIPQDMRKAFSLFYIFTTLAFICLVFLIIIIAYINFSGGHK